MRITNFTLSQKQVVFISVHATLRTDQGISAENTFLLFLETADSDNTESVENEHQCLELVETNLSTM